MKVYIAGKITGDPSFKSKFAAAHRELIYKFDVVLNPAILPKGLDYEEYMAICFAMLDVADAIYLLRDYKRSPGALRELERAKKANKLIMEEV